MIFITMMFGEKYINSYFDNALYSICMQKNFEKINKENDSVFLILTTSESERFVREGMRRLGDWASKCKFEVRSFNVGEQDDVYFKRTLPLVMLRYAITYCLNSNKEFFLLCPDTVYSSNVLEYSVDQYKLTGKIVSIFNGKSTLKFSDTKEIRNSLSKRRGIVDLYINNWTDHVNLLVMEEANPENIIIDDHATIQKENYISIYTSNPNPTYGKFEMQDLLFFEKAQTFEAWDHFWKDRLAEQHRLFVQTNLELGMSLELEDSTSTISGERAMQAWLERQKSVEIVRGISNQFLETPRALSDYRKHGFGNRLSMVNFSARLD